MLVPFSKVSLPNSSYNAIADSPTNITTIGTTISTADADSLLSTADTVVVVAVSYIILIMEQDHSSNSTLTIPVSTSCNSAIEREVQSHSIAMDAHHALATYYCR